MTRDLIIFGEDWGRHPSSTQHLIKHLSDDRQVVWINSIGLRRPRLTQSDLLRAAGKLRKAVQRSNPTATEPIPTNISVVNPLALPLPGNPVAARINRAVLGQRVRRIARERGLQRPVLWASLPTAIDVVGACGESGVVYYCGDDFGALAGVDHRPVVACEQRLAEASDVIFAASDVLCARFDRSKTVHLPHGVDVDMFSSPAERARDLPTDGPIAGFYGSLSDWLDQDLLVACAEKLPDWTFLLIGDVRTNVEKLKTASNIQFLGPRAHQDLPSYVQHWDVSLMPFVDNAQIRACNPLKLREYMAAGTPIVATPFPALSGYSDNLLQARDADAFSAALVAAQNDKPAARRNRQSAVAADSWQQRAAEVRDHIDAI